MQRFQAHERQVPSPKSQETRNSKDNTWWGHEETKFLQLYFQKLQAL